MPCGGRPCNTAAGAGVHRHTEAVTVEFEQPVTASGTRAILRDVPGVMAMNARDDGGCITPPDCAGEDAVFVSRVRRDPTGEHGLSFWCVPDLRKGAAWRAVQIAEVVVAQGLLKQAA